MARGPDGQGGGAGFSLKDQLFNEQSLGDLSREFAVLPGFDADRFHVEAMSRLPELGLLERMEWMADCLEQQLPQAFPAMAEALEAAMPVPLDPSKTDGDFGRFIHALPGILAVRHGLSNAATQRFSMEFYIRPFLNAWPDETMARLDLWARDENYHVRRLVSEGTRARLPWAANISLDPLVPLRFLDVLHADRTRYVTRSVANHMNDISKIAPDVVVARLRAWGETGRQAQKEHDWMCRHALRTAVKRGERAALEVLGYRQDAPLHVAFGLTADEVKIGDAVEMLVTLTADEPTPVMVDYRIRFCRPGRACSEKVFKLKVGKAMPGRPLNMRKLHRLKGDASTFKLHPGPHRITLQVNGVDRGEIDFDVLPA
ncbi:MAG: hypothetical protein MK160_15180 [Rhodobacteraceae bacterium]|nr:hypothetical protein [Paracoccaceae bacterium]